MDIFCEESPCRTMWAQIASDSKLRVLEGAVKDTLPWWLASLLLTH